MDKPSKGLTAPLVCIILALVGLPIVYILGWSGLVVAGYINDDAARRACLLIVAHNAWLTGREW